MAITIRVAGGERRKDGATARLGRRQRRREAQLLSLEEVLLRVAADLDHDADRWFRRTEQPLDWMKEKLDR